METTVPLTSLHSAEDGAPGWALVDRGRLIPAQSAFPRAAQLSCSSVEQTTRCGTYEHLVTEEVVNRATDAVGIRVGNATVRSEREVVMTWWLRRTGPSVLLALLALTIGLGPSGVVPQPKAIAAASAGAWTVYHHDDGHTGYDSTLPQVSSVSTGWVSGAMDAQVYASPLVYNGLVYAATLNNSVYDRLWLRLDDPAGAGRAGTSQRLCVLFIRRPRRRLWQLSRLGCWCPGG